MTTTLEMIEGASRLIGQLAAGETMDPGDANDALNAFNDMAESWSTERLTVFTTSDQTFVWPASTRTRSLGPTGDFVGTRPVKLDDATYFVDTSTGISYGIDIVNTEQYNAIALKTAGSTYPQWIWPSDDYPNTVFSIFPVPTKALTWHFVSVAPLTQSATLATTLVFPPGYQRAFRFNLACELAPEFGVEPSQSVRRIAMASKRNLKRINNPGDLMSMPASILRTSARFNIFSGN
jgi:hypothetical protein